MEVETLFSPREVQVKNIENLVPQWLSERGTC